MIWHESRQPGLWPHEQSLGPGAHARRQHRRRSGDHRGPRLAAGAGQRPGRQHSRAVPFLRHSRHQAHVASLAAEWRGLDAPRLRSDRHAAGADGAARRGPVAGAARAGRQSRRLRCRRRCARRRCPIRPAVEVSKLRIAVLTDDGDLSRLGRHPAGGPRGGRRAGQPRRDDRRVSSGRRRAAVSDRRAVRHLLRPDRRRRRRRCPPLDPGQHARLARCAAAVDRRPAAANADGRRQWPAPGRAAVDGPPGVDCPAPLGRCRTGNWSIASSSSRAPRSITSSAQQDRRHPLPAARPARDAAHQGLRPAGRRQLRDALQSARLAGGSCRDNARATGRRQRTTGIARPGRTTGCRSRSGQRGTAAWACKSPRCRGGKMWFWRSWPPWKATFNRQADYPPGITCSCRELRHCIRRG